MMQHPRSAGFNDSSIGRITLGYTFQGKATARSLSNSSHYFHHTFEGACSAYLQVRMFVRSQITTAL